MRFVKKDIDPNAPATADQTCSFESLIELSSRKFRGSVIAANDQSFRPKENLIQHEPVSPKHLNPGGASDGWETRRRRDPGHDWAIVRLGIPGVIRGAIIDTAFYYNNAAEYASLEACAMEGYPSEQDLTDPSVEWVELVPKSKLRFHHTHKFEINDERRFTHVRLNNIPSGGISRLRVFGEVVPDLREFAGLSIDLAAIENGGQLVSVSDEWHNKASNLLCPYVPYLAKREKWEASRRYVLDGKDWMIIKLAGAALIGQVIVDSEKVFYNHPDAISVYTCDATKDDMDDPNSWWEVVPYTKFRRDCRQKYNVASDRQATHVRLDCYPDGTLNQVCVLGNLTEKGKSDVALRWFNLLPAQHLNNLLGSLGVDAQAAQSLATQRPFSDAGAIESALAKLNAQDAETIRNLLALKK
ncbi:allantoicase [Desulfitobacterium sp. LBE]|uniref:allantoicase n=1 Tax=Desulfitobacterium sp. LBE TaxID=884086 RepID=UPI00119BB7A5|nr:allantoicase [Desulfitobacterium sp. LBE]TWH58127.1 allantoicase [Desulfitobacterium sp. LBE]